MFRMIVVALANVLLVSGVTQAQVAGAPEVVQEETEYSSPSKVSTRFQIGYGRLTSNDLIGDGKDRWRTGSISASRIFGYGWNGSAPVRFGELWEFRMQGQIIAPEDLTTLNASDRPWAGALSFGLHSHMQRDETEFALGADLVFIGPQTRLDSLQDALHGALGAPRPSDAMLAQQIPDKIRPTLVFETGQVIDFSGAASLRPFVEARAGDETLVRIGADVNVGLVGRGELLVRDPVTGQRYRAVYDSAPGYSFTIGGDIAYVADSVYLPDDRGYELTSHRDRARVGVHWQGEKASAFYGLTYLGKEFSGQSEGQVTGSLRLKLRF
ncbi:lipid A-modifier LpxR family protein [Parasedimentitalea marina]|nr:lipid A-modifier LpxR family protein [Parasedimentitalea marina]